MTLDVASLPWCKRLLIWRRQTVTEPWISRIVFLATCGQPRKEHANLRQRRITFGTVPLMPKKGSSASTMRSSRHSLKERNSNKAPWGKELISGGNGSVAKIVSVHRQCAVA